MPAGTTQARLRQPMRVIGNGLPPAPRRHCSQPMTQVTMKNSCSITSAYRLTWKNSTANSTQPSMPIHQE